MAAGVERDVQTSLGGVADRRDDVVRRLRVDDRHGTLVDGQVPGLPRRLPGLVAGQHDVARDAIAQVAKTGVIGRRGHRTPSCRCQCDGISASRR